jgi:ATP sulfurylase
MNRTDNERGSMYDETEAARLWDSERRDSPFSTVANAEDEYCDACGDAHTCEDCTS